jgi:uncharacterized protein
MLLVRTRLAQSEIHGLGVFSLERIRSGTKTWEWTKGVDLEIPASSIVGLGNISSAFFRKFAYKSGDTLYLCSDEARYMNSADGFFKSFPRNQDSTRPDGDYALRDIEAGEELLVSYSDFRERMRKFGHSMTSSSS